MRLLFGDVLRVPEPGERDLLDYAADSKDTAAFRALVPGIVIRGVVDWLAMPNRMDSGRTALRPYSRQVVLPTGEVGRFFLLDTSASTQDPTPTPVGPDQLQGIVTQNLGRAATRLVELLSVGEAVQVEYGRDWEEALDVQRALPAINRVIMPGDEFVIQVLDGQYAAAPNGQPSS